jgi:hypothetical protein
MVPCLVPASAARAYVGIWVETAARAALANAIVLRWGQNEAAFSAGELCLVAGCGLSRQVDECVIAAMEHQEST